MFNVIDLFCGAGGLSLGFQEAGFNVKMGIDFNQHAINTHHYNFPNSISIVEDLTQSNPQTILERYNLNKNEIHGIIGGPPCQGFSIAGKRMIDDSRNRLFLEFVRFVEYIKPKFFLIENVPGLLSMNKGKVKNEIIEIFTSLGYTVEYQILNSADFNVPQVRKRLFFIGILDGIPKFPEAITNLYKTVWEAISDLPPLSLGQGGDEILLDDGRTIYNHYAFPLEEINRLRVESIPEGGSHKDIPTNLQRRVEYSSAYRRLDRDKPSYTINAHFRDEYLIHPTQDRVITVREAARIQTFPDHFKFIGPNSRKGQCGLVGNAVPPQLARHIALSIINTIK